MYIFWFCLWVILNGKWTAEIAVFGLIFAAVMFLFSTLFLGFGPKREARSLFHAWQEVLYGCMLLREIVKANLNVMRMILTPGFEPHPKLVHFSSGLKDHRVVLADSITLTPGTITCMLNGDHYTVHCLDASLAEGLADGCFVKMLHAFEDGKPKKRKAEIPEEPAAEPAQEAPAEQIPEEAAEMPETAQADPEEPAAEPAEVQEQPLPETGDSPEPAEAPDTGKEDA